MIHHTGRNPTAGKTADSRLHFSPNKQWIFRTEAGADSLPKSYMEGGKKEKTRKKKTDKKEIRG